MKLPALNGGVFNGSIITKIRLITMDPINLIHEGKIKRYFRAANKLTAPDLISHTRLP